MPRCVRCANEMPALTVFCPRCQHPNEPDFQQLLQQTLNQRFQLYRQLGEGGLSTVFAAIDLQTDQTVVVKVSDPRHLTQTTFHSDAERQEARQYWAEMTDRMQREVAALTHVQHPNIVRVLAAGTISADLSYVVMELLRGKTLREEMNVRTPLPISEAIAIAAEVATALSVIHARGIVHRDLTPRNIFLCEVSEGRRGEEEKGRKGERETLSPPLPHSPTPLRSSSVKLIDFGIAKFPKQPGAQTYTQHAVMAGTPGYASPEQFQNLPVDHRADIYSLGVMLYEMVTGEKPFPGRSATEIALKQMRDEAVRPRMLVPELPIRLEALILRALAKDPAVRQQSAEELAAELRAISARIEIPLRAAQPAAAMPVLPLMKPAEPSGTEIFTLLSDLVAKPEPPRAAPAPAAESSSLPPGPETPAVKLESPAPQRQRAVLAAAAMALLFIAGTWLWARQNTAVPAPAVSAITPTPSSTAAPTPTLRPDITAPHTSAATTSAREPLLSNANKPAPTLATQPAPAPPSAVATKPLPSTEKPTIQTTRATPTPTPQIAAARVPPVTIPQPPARVEPTPSPAPPPVRNEPPPIDTGGWKREPAPPLPRRTERTPEPTPTPREAVVMEPKVIPWQGYVNGSREVTLELPGVPGMVDIPQSFRKRVGIKEPPSPSNGWRRAVLRVFGNGDVSLVIRWWPHRLTSVSRREIVARLR